MPFVLKRLFYYYFVVLCTPHCVWWLFVDLGFGMHYFVSLLVLESSLRGKES